MLDAVMTGSTWTPDTLKERIKMMASRGALGVEKEVRAVQTAKRMRTDVTGYGINDYSAHDHAGDAYWEQWEVRRDGPPRYDPHGQYSSGYGDCKRHQIESPKRPPKGPITCFSVNPGGFPKPTSGSSIAPWPLLRRTEKATTHSHRVSLS
jgi:hypothetical protein